MMADISPQNVWGDIDSALDPTITPLTILQEYAATLGPRTSNLVTARVARSVNSGKEGDEMRLVFQLVAPLLGPYVYGLFSVEHLLVQLYPADVVCDQLPNQPTRTDTPVALRKIVGTILGMEGTTEAVRAMLSQSVALRNLSEQDKPPSA